MFGATADDDLTHQDEWWVTCVCVCVCGGGGAARAAVAGSPADAYVICQGSVPNKIQNNAP